MLTLLPRRPSCAEELWGRVTWAHAKESDHTNVFFDAGSIIKYIVNFCNLRWQVLFNFYMKLFNRNVDAIGC